MLRSETVRSVPALLGSDMVRFFTLQPGGTLVSKRLNEASPLVSTTDRNDDRPWEPPMAHLSNKPVHAVVY